MESVLARHCVRSVVAAAYRRPCLQQSRRAMATINHDEQAGGAQSPIRAARELPEENGRVVFNRKSRASSSSSSYTQSRAEMIESPTSRARGSGGRVPRQRRGGEGGEANQQLEDAQSHPLLRRIRIVPASPSYFTATPQYTDDLLSLSALLRKYQLLPLWPPGEAPRVAWKTMAQYKAEVAEPVRAKSYKMLLELLSRLNYIHSSLIPTEVTEALEKYKRLVQPHHNRPNPIIVDKDGKSRAVGRRKSSVAKVFVVEGEGKVFINGKTLAEYFGRLHDRESAVWALKASQRMDKYNVWALTHGGGTTGQADAISLGLAKALLAHEPDLKPALRRARVITRDPRRVERKKPGKLKARKMPAWVKR